MAAKGKRCPACAGQGHVDEVLCVPCEGTGKASAAGKYRDKKHLGRSVYELALDRTRYVFERFDHVAVSFSGGKDSTVILNLAIQAATEAGRLPVDVVFFDEEAIPPTTVDYCARVAALPTVDFRWYCLPVRHRNACSEASPTWYPWAPEVRDLWVRPLPERAITTASDFPVDDPERRPSIPEYAARLWNPQEHGTTAALMGIRADESLYRQQSVRSRAGDNFIVRDYHQWGFGNVSQVYPIYDWTDPDVWLAPAVKGWDHNRTYDIMEMLGVSRRDQRCAPPFGEEPIRNLWMFAQAWPELWDRMVVRVPGAATAARYGTSVLYGVGELPTKPDDMPWETFLLGLVGQHSDPAVRGQVAMQVKRNLRTHYARTQDPLVYHALHPVTGMSWKYLVGLAIRADLKARRGHHHVPKGEKEEGWRRYRAELAAGGDKRMLPTKSRASA